MAGSGKRGRRHTVSVQIFEVHNFHGLPFSNILRKHNYFTDQFDTPILLLATPKFRIASNP